MAPPPKRRRIAPLKQIPQELTFDPSARQEYLSGFSKRKTARKEAAREQAIKRDKEERVKERAQLRAQRKEDLKAHVEAVDAEVRKQRGVFEDAESQSEGEVEWGDGEGDIVQDNDGEEEEEYVDEEKFTTVTIEPMGMLTDDIDDELEREGLAKKLAAETAQAEKEYAEKNRKLKPWEKPRWDGKEKKKNKVKKFRYETKAERSISRMKQKSKNSSQAKARRGREE